MPILHLEAWGDMDERAEKSQELEMPLPACWLGGHYPGTAIWETFGGIHRTSLGLERSSDALQSRDRCSDKPLVWGVETLPKKASSMALPGDIIDSPRLVIPLPNQRRSGGSGTTAC